jgi:hypothetical protein
MANVVVSPYNTSPAYSGSFIPQLWSKRLNAQYYLDNQLAEIVNTNWEGEIKNQGDTVRIRTAPNLSISDYVIGGSLNYEVPTPIYQDFTIDKAKSFGFAVNDVLEAQSDIDLMNMFMEDASKQLKISIADECYNTLMVGTSPAAGTRPVAAKNQGANAGIKSGALSLGTDLAALDVSNASTGAATLLKTILQLGAALDEQNVPESGRWLLMSPYDRQILMQSNLAQAYFTGDQSSIIRTGKIGMIDRFSVYVSNMLPRGAASKAWVSGQTDPSTGATYGSAVARRMIVAGTKDAFTHAAQVNKTETVRNPSDFGDLVRGLTVYGRKVVKPEAAAIAVVA